MKSVIFATIPVLVLLTSCDNREDVFAKMNEGPVILVEKNGVEITVFRDTVKIGHSLILGYKIVDEENLELQVDESDGLSVQINGSVFQISIDGISEGEKVMELHCEDSFLRKTKREVEIYSFFNMNPVAALSLSKISGLEVDIDGRGSYDPDERFGGGLNLYEYNIQGITYQSDKNRITFVYGTSGTKTVMLRARDNNGVWSTWVTEYIVL